MRMLGMDKQSEEDASLGEKKSVQYIIEREFLSKFSIEELLIRIIKFHIDNK